MRELDLDKTDYDWQLPKSAIQFMMEAAIFCLSFHGHKSGVKIQVSGDFDEVFSLKWKTKVSKEMKSYWRDTQEATEFGASGIAILLLNELTEFTIFQRGVIGEYVDFQLIEKSIQP